MLRGRQMTPVAALPALAICLAFLSCAPAPVDNASAGNTVVTDAGLSCSLIQLPPYDRPCDEVCAAEGAQCPGPANAADPISGCTEPAAGSPFYMCRCCAVSR